MTIKRLVIFAISILFICTVLYFADKRANNTPLDSKKIIERWNRTGDTITYSKIDFNQCIATILEPKYVNTATILEQKYVIDAVDSSFIFQGKKIYLFEDASKVANFPNMEQYFHNHLPSINVDIEITIWMAAIVDKDGQINHIGIIREPSYYSYILPTIDVIGKMPHWNSAHIANEKVASLVMFPVHHEVK